ncbi:S1C family serine protease [Microscilla marina]|uniref:Trypsin domain protein n=1 Tax=Microscilla marina ATCC 23134 TaxID=313606 RepID=A2A021_MICM2|nr:S1C family serine protease [Microscilla marina]EAY24016.1 trypsin domain protein [Microscilla marina ATCC 23134]
MKKSTFTFLLLSFLLSSCATILNGKYQKVAIITDQNNQVYINGKKAQEVKGKYRLRRDGKAKVITVKQEGYKNESIVVMQSKKSPWYKLSIFPFGVILAFMGDSGDKTYDYAKQLKVGTKMTPSITARSKDMKQLRLNKVEVDVNSENLKYRISNNYPGFLLGEHWANFKNINQGDELKFKNTIFTSMLNNLLKDKGYIDTTIRALKNSYLNNLYLNATIDKLSINTVAMSNRLGCTSESIFFGKFLYVALSIRWKVLDYYKHEVYTTETQSLSSHAWISNYNWYGSSMATREKEAFHHATKDAVERGLIELMSAKKMQELLRDKSQQEKEARFTALQVAKPKAYVSNFNQAVQASVTIKHKEGHGSGFVISNNGHIITNYHVIANRNNLSVIFENGKSYNAKVLRSSKIYDLAVLKIEAENLLPFKISTDKNFEIAQDIYTVGTPTAEDLSQTITKGIISGIRNKTKNIQLIQIDASVNAGNSGGVIVNKQGVVLGVISSKLSGYGIEGVAFGVPAYEIFNKLKVVLTN